MNVSSQPGPKDELIQKLTQIVLENLNNEQFGVSELAENVGMNRSHLYRKIIVLTNKSLSQFIREIRLSEALKLLKEESITVSEVAYRVGFNNPNYFNTAFKNHYKVSPGDVKKGAIIPSNHSLTGKEHKVQAYLSSKINGLSRQVRFILVAIVLTGIGAVTILTTSRPSEISIAVLPFENMTGYPYNAFYADGMHEALIGGLKKIASLHVIGRRSTLRYRSSDKLLKDIAQELDVNFIVKGSLLTADDSVRMIIQLIKADSRARHPRARSTGYNDEISNVVMVQSEATQDIVRQVHVNLKKIEKQRLKASRKINPDSYADYLRGMYYMNEGTVESHERGMKYLLGAIEKDPGDPLAYGRLALGYATVGHSQQNSEESFNRATWAAERAIELDPSLDEAYIALASLYLYHGHYDWPLTKKAFENALERNPNSEYAHAHFAWYHVLYNDLDEAIYHAKMAVKLEPFSSSYHSWLALLYFYNKEYDKAEQWARKTLELKNDHPYGIYVLGLVALQRGQYEKAIEYHEQLPENIYWMVRRGYAYVKAGQRVRALEYWNELEELSKTREVNPCHMGMMAAYLGFKDKAFELLNIAADNNRYPITYIQSQDFENIRDDSRYNNLLQKMNLPVKQTILTSN